MKDDWRLNKIELEFQNFGDNKGKYVILQRDSMYYLKTWTKRKN